MGDVIVRFAEDFMSVKGEAEDVRQRNERGNSVPLMESWEGVVGSPMVLHYICFYFRVVGGLSSDQLEQVVYVL